MERLTYVTETGEVLFCPEDLPEDEGMTIIQLAKDGRYKELVEIAERLANREQAEEQGRLLRLPCKVGDTVYKITRNFISEYKIISAAIYPYSIQFNWQCTKGIYGNLVGFADHEIGKTVFLTQEEAEAKLKEMEESHEGE